MKVELHSHTHHSHGKKILYDGVEQPEAMVRHAKEIGLGALAITDHDTMLGVKEALAAGKKHSIIVIPGEEISSLQGHVIALGIQETIRPGLNIFDTADLIHAQGGVAVAVHPFDIKHDGLREYAKVCDAVEIFNAINMDRISNRMARTFAGKNKMVGVAGSDAHSTAMLGKGTVNTKSTDMDSILKSIRKGSVTVSYSYPSVSVIMNYAIRKLKMSYDYTWNYMEENYKNPKKFIAKRMLTLVKRSPGGVDKLFSLMAYTAFASVVAYSALSSIKR